jgi:hypothetical protein
MSTNINSSTKSIDLWLIFANNFITTLLGIFPHEIGKKRAFFTLGLGPIFGPKNAVRKLLTGT